MKASQILKGMLVAGVMVLPFAGCDSSGSTKDNGAVGPSTAPVTKADISKVNEGAKGMGPVGNTPKK